KQASCVSSSIGADRGRGSSAIKCVPCLQKDMSSALKKQRLDAVNADGIPPATAMPEPAEAAAASMEEDSRLGLLREKMRQHEVSAYLVETQDAHQSEYVADHDKRREWLTGFTGSAGTALVTSTSALMWTDGRYFLQADQQLRSGWSLMRIGERGVPTVEQWVEQEAAAFRDAEAAATVPQTDPAAPSPSPSPSPDQTLGEEGQGGAGGEGEVAEVPVPAAAVGNGSG
ncbi:unnamed protein product, partial [Laminaria digitata]